jgi:hypothetical protein
MAMTTIVAWAAGTVGATFESRTGRTASTITTAIGAATTAVWTATAAAVSITAATLRALETGARIAAADACRIAREVFAWSGGSADARGASFTWEQDDVVFDDGRSCGNFSGVRFDHFCFGVFVFGVLMLTVLAIAMLDVFVVGVFVIRVFCMFVNDVLGIAQSGGVFGAFVRGVGFEFGAIGGAMFLDFLGFFLGEFGFRGGLVFGGVEVRFFLAVLFFGFFVFGKFGFAGGVNFLSVVLFEFGAANEGIGFGVVGSFLVFCFG